MLEFDSDYTETSGNARFFGTGGITKTGSGTFALNNGKTQTFTGPLVSKNGTFASTVGYKATAFRAEGGNLALSGALSAANVSFAATDGGTLTLAGATITDASPDVTLVGGGKTDYFTRDGVVGAYALDSLTLGPGAVLDLDADAMTVDAISATTTNITATAADNATINLNFSAAPAVGQTFVLFETDSADKFAVVPKLDSLTLLHEESVVDGRLVMTIVAEDYTWKADKPNWGDENAWRKSGADATWTDGNNAVFSTANAEAVLAAPAVASKVEVSADATISGSATLTAVSVNVAIGTTATISAPSDGTMNKTGPGTLTLTKSREGKTTTVTEGTLALTGGINVGNLMLGTDATKPVVFDYDGQTLSKNWTDYFATGMDITLTNGTYRYESEPVMDNTSLPSALTIAKDATFSTGSRFKLNVLTSSTAGGVTNTINVAGGRMIGDSNDRNWIMQNSRSGTLVLNVTDGGLLQFGSTGAGTAALLSSRDIPLGEATDPALLMTFNSSTFRCKAINLGYDYDTVPRNRNPQNPLCMLAMTNSVLDALEVRVGHDVVGAYTGGSYTADFDGCIVTAKEFIVYHDRPANAAHFNGTTLSFPAAGGKLKTAQAFDTLGAGGTAIVPVTVGAKGLVIDNQEYSGALEADLGGTGAVTKKGDGKLTIVKSQTASAALVCEEGETFLSAGLTMNRPVTVKDGATFTVEATNQATIANLTLDAGATLNIDKPTLGVTPFAIGTLTLPVEGKATLKVDGASLPAGRYAVLSKTGIVAGDFANLEVSVSGGISASYSVEGGTLFVEVRGANDYVWTGFGDGETFSVGANWLGGVPPNGANLYIGVTSASTLACDIANFEPQSITFSEGSSAVTIAGDIAGITAITNKASVNQTFAGSVSFGNGNVNVVQSGTYKDSDKSVSEGCVVFAGGVTGSDVANHKVFTGDYTLTKTAKFSFATTGNDRYVVNTNSTLNVKNTDTIHELYIKNGATFHIENASHGWSGNSGSDHRLWYYNEGTVIADSYTLNGNGTMWLGGYVNDASSSDRNKNAIFKVGNITVNSSGKIWLHGWGGNGGDTLTTYVGSGGINIASGKTGYVGVENSSFSPTVRPWNSDFRIGSGGAKEYDFSLNSSNIVFNLDTDDEQGVPRTITLAARLKSSDDTSSFVVKGAGTNIVTSYSTRLLGTNFVSETATEILTDGAGFPNGTVSVAAGATLAVGESGTASVSNLVLAAGATLAFNFTDRRTPPVLAVASDKTVTAEGAVKIAVSGKWPKVTGTAKTVALTSGGKFTGKTVSLASGAPTWAKSVDVINGDIVLEVKPMAVMVTVK